jgi:DNA polymerase-4
MTLRSLYLDLNSFFASCEQQHDPALRGRPVGVVPMITDTTSLLAASVQAKKFGCRTGTRVWEAKRLCPDIVLIASNTDRYLEMHRKVKEAVDTVLPIEKVWSIDEMHCTLLGAQRQREVAVELAGRIKRALREHCGACMTCSIGIAPNRMLAKLGTDMKKPDGLVVIEQSELPQRLWPLKLTDFAGIGAKTEKRLRRAGISSVREMCEASEADLRRAFESVIGAEWYHRLRGQEIIEKPTRTRSIGHEHVLGPSKRSRDGARGVLVRLIHKAAARARGKGFVAGSLGLYVRTVEGFKWKRELRLEPLTSDTITLVKVFAQAWEEYTAIAHGRVPMKVRTVLGDLELVSATTPMLFSERRPSDKLAQAMDKVNAKFGRNTICTASMSAFKSTAPTRIAFSNVPEMDERV